MPGAPFPFRDPLWSSGADGRWGRSLLPPGRDHIQGRDLATPLNQASELLGDPLVHLWTRDLALSQSHGVGKQQVGRSRHLSLPRTWLVTRGRRISGRDSLLYPHTPTPVASVVEKSFTCHRLQVFPQPHQTARGVALGAGGTWAAAGDPPASWTGAEHTATPAHVEPSRPSGPAREVCGRGKGAAGGGVPVGGGLDKGGC